MGFFDKLKSILKPNAAKIKKSIGIGIKAIIKKKSNSDAWRSLVEALILADVAPKIANDMVASLPANLKNESEAINQLSDQLYQELKNYQKSLDDFFTINKKPKVVLMLGVNGSGKTTTLAKFSAMAKERGLKPLLVAGDSFRAAAISQLTTWAKKLAIDYFETNQTTDPAAIAHMGYQKAIENNNDIVFIDTAGRLHTNHNLMNEVEKIIRVLKKIDPRLPDETIMTLDATGGQNALAQVGLFNKSAPLSAIVITKMDGIAKGGMVVSVVREYRLPLLALGVGEKPADLDNFSAKEFSQSFFGKE